MTEDVYHSGVVEVNRTGEHDSEPPQQHETPLVNPLDVPVAQSRSTDGDFTAEERQAEFRISDSEGPQDIIYSDERGSNLVGSVPEVSSPSTD